MSSVLTAALLFWASASHAQEVLNCADLFTRISRPIDFPQTHAELLSRAAAQGDPQALFEKQWGLVRENISHDGTGQDQLVAHANEALKRYYDPRGTPPEKRLRAGLVYSRDGQVKVMTSALAEIPRGFERVHGNLSSVEYYRTIKDRIVILDGLGVPIRFFGLEIPDSSLMSHDLAHLGGMLADEEYQEELVDLADWFVTNAKKPTNPQELTASKKLYFRMAFFVESLSVARQTERDLIADMFGAVRFDMQKFRTVESAEREVAGVWHKNLYPLAELLLRELPRVEAVGGGSRDYTEVRYFTSAVEAGIGLPLRYQEKLTYNQAEQGLGLLTACSLRGSLSYLKLKHAYEAKDEPEMRRWIAELLTKASHLYSLRVSDWVSAVKNDGGEGAQRVFDFFCKSGVFARISGAIAGGFCN